jgi:hypothetical protein
MHSVRQLRCHLSSHGFCFSRVLFGCSGLQRHHCPAGQVRFRFFTQAPPRYRSVRCVGLLSFFSPRTLYNVLTHSLTSSPVGEVSICCSEPDYLSLPLRVSVYVDWLSFVSFASSPFVARGFIRAAPARERQKERECVRVFFCLLFLPSFFLGLSSFPLSSLSLTVPLLCSRSISQEAAVHHHTRFASCASLQSLA